MPMLLSYPLKFLRSLLSRSRLLVLLIVSTTILSSMMIFLSFGLFRNAQNARLAEIVELTELPVTLGGEGRENVTKRELNSCFADFSAPLQRAISFILIRTEIDGYKTECRFTLAGGDYLSFPRFGENLQKNGIADAYFSPQQESSGARVAIAADRVPASFSLQGHTYQVIGRQRWNDGLFLPFSALDDDTAFSADDTLILFFSQAVTPSQYDELCRVFAKQLGGRAALPSIAPNAPDQFSVLSIFSLVALLLIADCALNLVILFRYLLTEHSPLIAVLRLGGLRRTSAVRFCLTEYIFLFLPAAALGALLYRLALFPVLLPFFPYMRDAFSWSSCFLLFFAYCLLSLLAVCIAAAVQTQERDLSYLLRRTDL